MPSRLRVALVPLLMLLVVVTHAQSWDYEKQRTLREMIALRQAIIGHRHPIFSGSEAREFALNNSAVTSRVKLRYMGERRELPAASRRLLDGMARTFSLNPDGIKQLTEEVLFKEGDKEYWMPVKKEIISVLESLRIGDEVTLYIDLVGAYRTAGEWKWVFTVNDLA